MSRRNGLFGLMCVFRGCPALVLGTSCPIRFIIVRLGIFREFSVLILAYLSRISPHISKIPQRPPHNFAEFWSD